MSREFEVGPKSIHLFPMSANRALKARLVQSERAADDDEEYMGFLNELDPREYLANGNSDEWRCSMAQEVVERSGFAKFECRLASVLNGVISRAAHNNEVKASKIVDSGLQPFISDCSG